MNEEKKIIDVNPEELPPGWVRMDPAKLYESHTITDGVVADIVMLVPFQLDGLQRDPQAMKMRFFSSVQVSLGMQAFPVKYEIEAATLQEAIARQVPDGIAAAKKFAEQVESQQARQRILAGTPAANVRPS